MILSEEEQEIVLKELQQSSPDTLYPLILCYMHTGCRRAELAELRWKQVDFENGLIHIDTGKTGKVRSLRMTSEIRLVLAKLSRNSAYVFTNDYGNRFTHSHFDRHLKNYQRTSCVNKPWTIHDLRRTFAYHFLRKGGQVYQLQALMGHRNIQVTVDVYAQLGSSCV